MLDLVRSLDRDELILLWTVELDELIDRLGAPGTRRALRYRLATPRLVGEGSDHGRPAAELDLVAWIEPEPGCP